VNEKARMNSILGLFTNDQRKHTFTSKYLNQLLIWSPEEKSACIMCLLNKMRDEGLLKRLNRVSLSLNLQGAHIVGS
jgi:hypothetical protein